MKRIKNAIKKVRGHMATNPGFRALVGLVWTGVQFGLFVALYRSL